MQETRISFDVPGPYAVKGSTFSFIDRTGRLRTKTDSKHGPAFLAAVRWAAASAGVRPIPKGRGVVVSVVYGFCRPKGRQVRAVPCVRPDLDKLDRALLDALTGVAYHDDGQVVALSSRKVYGDRLVAHVVIAEEA